MLREVCIIILAVCGVFTFVPIAHVAIFSPILGFLPMVFLFVVLVYAGYDAKKLYDTKEHGLLQSFVLFLIFAIVLSFILMYLSMPYLGPRVVS
jgi:hypothetical protein